MNNETSPVPQNKRARARKGVALPNPIQYAERLPQSFRAALLNTVDNHRSGGRVDPAHADVLRSYGLVGYGTTGLTAFGISVRSALIRMKP